MNPTNDNIYSPYSRYLVLNIVENKAVVHIIQIPIHQQQQANITHALLQICSSNFTNLFQFRKHSFNRTAWQLGKDNEENGRTMVRIPISSRLHHFQIRWEYSPASWAQSDVFPFLRLIFLCILVRYCRVGGIWAKLWFFFASCTSLGISFFNLLIKD